MLRTLFFNYCLCILVLAGLTGIVHGDYVSPNETGKEKKVDHNKKLSEALQDVDRFLQELQKRPLPVNQQSATLETLRVLPKKLWTRTIRLVKRPSKNAMTARSI